MTETCSKYKTTHLIRPASAFEDCRADLNVIVRYVFVDCWKLRYCKFISTSPLLFL
jgi:hypothetical protein